GTNVIVAIVSTITNGLCGNTFATTRTWSATDACGNSNTCSQTVTVVDMTPPVLVCAADKTVECGSGWSFDPPTGAIDNCSGSNVTIVVVNTMTNMVGFCGNTFSATRTWSATDA